MALELFRKLPPGVQVPLACTFLCKLNRDLDFLEQLLNRSCPRQSAGVRAHFCTLCFFSFFQKTFFKTGLSRAGYPFKTGRSWSAKRPSGGYGHRGPVNAPSVHPGVDNSPMYDGEFFKIKKKNGGEKPAKSPLLHR